MISIAICDDELHELAYAQTLITKYALEHQQYEIKMYSFETPLEFLSHVAEHDSFDVMLLDIYMSGGILGTDVAKEVRKLGDDGEIIFITTSKDHALDAFKVDAAQYLVKPYEEVALFAALNKVMQRINVDGRHVITLKTSEGINCLAPRDVVVTETGRNNYQIIHTIQGKKLEVRMTASELFELLALNKFFVRCGVSINLNLKYIRQISKNAITFDTGECLAYPYRVYKKLKEDFLFFQMSEED